MEREDPRDPGKSPDGNDFPTVWRAGRNAHEGRALLKGQDKPVAKSIDDDGPRLRGLQDPLTVRDLGMAQVWPSEANRTSEWDCDRELRKLRNEAERFSAELRAAGRETSPLHD